jgi:predicted dehydrogenase
LVYMGEGRYGHYFMANLEEGVKYMSLADVQGRAGEFFFKRIRRFEGDYRQRQQALRRAQNANGRSYSLNSFNCEHFANLVQFGREWSQQVAVVKGAVALTLLAIVLNQARKSGK